ncbi:MAG: hypothetical protein QGH83_12235 [Candidatus Pacebacteria bacterium]|jgi:hypothetical protein|nr:hypothetical protein [Candidatus Paceibacterota bacterium]
MSNGRVLKVSEDCPLVKIAEHMKYKEKYKDWLWEQIMLENKDKSPRKEKKKPKKPPKKLWNDGDEGNDSFGG